MTDSDQVVGLMSGGTGAVYGCSSASREKPVRIPGSSSGAGTAFQEWPLVDMLELGSLPTAVPCARLHTRNILLEWHIGRPLVENAETLVSELVTNALKASLSLEEVKPIGLRLLANRERLIIEVWDHSPLDLERRQTDAESEHGRGLMILAALSNRWGSRHVSFSLKVVWCELLVGER